VLDYFIAMGAVLGIAAYGSTQEKLNGANNGGLGGAGLGTTYVLWLEHLPLL
jgi:hypothetical protein